MTDTRQQIVEAAVGLLREEAHRRPSVRAVAARAGVGASTLRYHFPTQQALIEAALSSVYETALPDERIHDTTIPARDRLAECLRNLLIPIGRDDRARRFWTELFTTLVDTRGRGYPQLVRLTEERLTGWLRVLQDEGAIPPGELGLAASYLLTVVDGLALARALPPEQADDAEEIAVIGVAIDAVLAGLVLGPGRRT